MPTEERALGTALEEAGLSHEKSGEAVGVARQAGEGSFARQ